MSSTKVKKGVCAAKGFVANGLNCGLNSDKNKNDIDNFFFNLKLADKQLVFLKSYIMKIFESC